MPQLMCMRTPADQVPFGNEDQRFVVCKAVGVKAGGRKFEMGDELPRGILNDRAMREIYDTPLRLIETMEYALADEELLAAMMARPSADPDGDGETESDDDEKDTDGDLKSAAPVVAGDGLPNKVRPAKGKKR